MTATGWFYVFPTPFMNASELFLNFLQNNHTNTHICTHTLSQHIWNSMQYVQEREFSQTLQMPVSQENMTLRKPQALC